MTRISAAQRAYISVFDAAATPQRRIINHVALLRARITPRITLRLYNRAAPRTSVIALRSVGTR